MLNLVWHKAIGCALQINYKFYKLIAFVDRSDDDYSRQFFYRKVLKKIQNGI